MLLPLRQDGARAFVRFAPPIPRLMIALLVVGGAVTQTARGAEPGVAARSGSSQAAKNDAGRLPRQRRSRRL